VARFRNRLCGLRDRLRAGTIARADVYVWIDAWIAHASQTDTFFKFFKDCPLSHTGLTAIRRLTFFRAPGRAPSERCRAGSFLLCRQCRRQAWRLFFRAFAGYDQIGVAANRKPGNCAFFRTRFSAARYSFRSRSS
jgi:hypothetical protein